MGWVGGVFIVIVVLVEVLGSSGVEIFLNVSLINIFV